MQLFVLKEYCFQCEKDTELSAWEEYWKCDFRHSFSVLKMHPHLQCFESASFSVKKMSWGSRRKSSEEAFLPSTVKPDLNPEPSTPTPKPQTLNPNPQLLTQTLTSGRIALVKLSA